MIRKFRNPATGETIIFEEEDEESNPSSARKAETVENKESESAKDEEETGEFRTPFDFLDEIDGKDVEKVAIGAVLGIGGVLALRGLFSFIACD